MKDPLKKLLKSQMYCQLSAFELRTVRYPAYFFVIVGLLSLLFLIKNLFYSYIYLYPNPLNVTTKYKLLVSIAIIHVVLRIFCIHCICIQCKYMVLPTNLKLEQFELVFLLIAFYISLKINNIMTLYNTLFNNFNFGKK